MSVVGDAMLYAPQSIGLQHPHPIRDVEKLVRRIVKDWRNKRPNVKFSFHDEEELKAFLISTAWELEGRYDVTKDKNPNFASYAAHILSLRVADWYRRRFGDTRHGEKPQVLSLDAPLSRNLVDRDGVPESGHDQLVETLAARTGDPAEDRSPDLVGVLVGGDRGGAQRTDGQAADDQVVEQAAAGAARGDRGRPRTVKPRVPGTYRAPRRPPVCSHCFGVFRKAFRKVNTKQPEHLKQTDEKVLERAALRAQAVKVGTEWCCPRCTKLEDPLGQNLMLTEAYPNRRARRDAVRRKELTVRKKTTTKE